MSLPKQWRLEVHYRYLPDKVYRKTGKMIEAWARHGRSEFRTLRYRDIYEAVGHLVMNCKCTLVGEDGDVIIGKVIEHGGPRR